MENGLEPVSFVSCCSHTVELTYFIFQLLTKNIMHDCIFKLLRAGDEESLESMCKLLFTIGKDLDSDKAKVSHFLST